MVTLTVTVNTLTNFSENEMMLSQYMYKEALKIKVVTVDLMHIGPEYGGRPSARHKVVSSSDRKYAAFHDLDSHSVVKSRYSLSKSEYQLFL